MPHGNSPPLGRLLSSDSRGAGGGEYPKGEVVGRKASLLEILANHIWFRSFCRVDDGLGIYIGYNNDDTENSFML